MKTRGYNGIATYNGDINNDGVAGDLIYIPANDSEINFKTDADTTWTLLGGGSVFSFQQLMIFPVWLTNR